MFQTTNHISIFRWFSIDRGSTEGMFSLLYIPYPLVNVYIAIEHGPVEIVSFPIDSMVDLFIVFC